ncbi:MAG: UDP-N-acetylmuramoyl-L-alanine--D-glutamate ligase [Thermodesulfobacteriota bacterium]
MAIGLKYFSRRGRRLLVVGAGRSGLAALGLAHSKGCELALSDGGPQENLKAEERSWLAEQKVRSEFSGHSAELFNWAEVIVVSPGVPLDLPPLNEARARGTAIIAEMEFASLFTSRPIIAITGTNGKSTVTSLIAELLREAGQRVFMGGNIGTPLSEFVTSGQEADLLVLEVSSFQLDALDSFHAKVALLLNISPDHLDRYPSFAAYADSKMRIFMNQGADDVAIINEADGEIAKRRGEINSRILTFAASDEVSSRLSVDLGPEPELYELPEELGREPNRQNALAAIQAVRALGYPVAPSPFPAFATLPHRLQRVAEVEGVRYVDDSKATNIGATISALAGQKGRVILIAGGRDKGGDYRLLIPEVERVVARIIVLGEAAEKIRTALAPVVAVEEVAELAQAVRAAADQARQGDTVLLAPACASFDMFTGYAQRGELFQQAVRELARRGGEEVV